MQIYRVNNINFTANKFVKKNIDPKKLSHIRNNADNDIRKGLYNDIDKFVNKQYTKTEYLKSINKLVKKIDNKVALNDAEKQYVGDMITTMDLSSKEKIPEGYIMENIEELLKNQK